jgi:uncharacterized protein
MALTIDDIRRQAVIRTLFPPSSLGDAIDRLGLIQADPICAPARAQELILRHRVQGYRTGDLERQYPALGLDEDLIHVYGYMPSRAVGLLHPRTGQWRVEHEHPDLPEQVLEYIRANGPTDHRVLEARFGTPTTRGNWGSPAKATTRVLEMLHYRGQLRVARRKGLVRWYEAASAVHQEPDPEQRLRSLVLLLARLHAPISPSALKMILRSFRWSAPSLSGWRTAVDGLTKSGDLEQGKVDGVTYLWPANEWVEGEVTPTVRFLAPFDPVVWDRARFEHLWGWPYRFEAYTPPAKRQWGYYALPVLWADQVIGWANVTAKGEQLRVEVGYVRGMPAGPEYARGLQEELDRLEWFLDRVTSPAAQPL